MTKLKERNLYVMIKENPKTKEILYFVFDDPARAWVYLYELKKYKMKGLRDVRDKKLVKEIVNYVKERHIVFKNQKIKVVDKIPKPKKIPEGTIERLPYPFVYKKLVKKSSVANKQKKQIRSKKQITKTEQPKKTKKVKEKQKKTEKPISIPTKKVEEAVRFTKFLYDGAKQGWMGIWAKEVFTTWWFKVGNFKELAQKAVELSQKGKNIYLNISLRNADLGYRKRGSLDQIIGVPGLWIEADVKGKGHKETNLPTSDKAVFKIISEFFPLKPSIIVSTGGGYHFYWIFDKVFYTKTKKKREEIQEIERKFTSAFINTMKSHNYKADNTSDLTRAFRLPGTYNVKNKEKIKEIKIKQLGKKYKFSKLKKEVERL